MSVRSTACGTISRGQSSIDSVHVVVEQDHVLRRTPVWRRRYEGREIERTRNREDPDTACKWDDLERTAPVGSFPGTAWGLHDMHGRSSSGSSTAGTRATRARQRMDKSGPRRPAGTARPHVVRSGSRYGAVDGARCISGNRSIPGYSINHFGFRVVCSSSIEGFYSREAPRQPRLRPAGRAGLDAASPTPRPPASRGAFASRSCRNRGPSAWAASPTRCRCGARRQCPPAPGDRRAAGGRPSGAAVVRGARAPPVPRARRTPDVRLSAQASRPTSLPGGFVTRSQHLASECPSTFHPVSPPPRAMSRVAERSASP
jgi:hypothetical protein